MSGKNDKKPVNPPLLSSKTHTSTDLRVRKGIPSASLFYLHVRGGAVVYRYDVEVSQSYGNNERLLTRSGVDVGKRILHRRLCEEIMKHVQAKSFGMARQDMPYVYDGKKNLYLTRDTGYAEKTFNIPKASIVETLSRFLSSDVVVTIKKSSSFVLHLSDFTGAVQPGAVSDQNLRTFFELLTTQSLYNLNRYDIVSSGLIFRRRINNENVYMQTQLQCGFKKGVRFIQGAGNRTNSPALVIDSLSAVFYPSITMYDLMKIVGKSKSLEDIEALYKGVRGYLVHDPKRTVVFEKFSDKIMREMKISVVEDKKERKVPFIDFYRDRKYEIEDANMYAIQCDVRNNCYPPELFRILPYQRVPTSKMNKYISTTMIGENAVIPSARQTAIINAVNGIDNKFLEKFGVQLDKTIIRDQCLVRDLPLPKYLLANNSVVNPSERLVVGKLKNEKTWHYEYKLFNKKFFVAATVPRMVVLHTDVEELRKKVYELLQVGGNCGMQFRRDEPVEFVELVDGFQPERDLEKYFTTFKTAKYEFVLMIDDSPNSHQLLKRLEVKYEILTQQIKLKTFMSAGFMTLRNIILKMNVKCGGVNYVPSYPTATELEKVKLDYSKDEFFIFSYDVAHPAPSTGSDKNKIFMAAIDEAEKIISSRQGQVTKAEKEEILTEAKKKAGKITSLEPSVVGYASNMAKNPYSFIGNYAYQQSRRECINDTVLTTCVNYCLDKAKANRPNFKPTGVFIIRDGVSEGQYNDLVNSEYNIIKKAVLARCNGVKFKFVVVNKRHGKRFFSNANDGDGNLVRGSIVDSVVVRPNFREFFLMSHTPLKGTAKVPQYAEIINGMDMPSRLLDEFLHVMCNLHQVSVGGVSIPAPVYLAHELAKRGRHNYLQYAREVSQNPLMDETEYANLTDRLSYTHLAALNNWRFTA